MKYHKPTLQYEQQADLLIDRGLVADRDVLITRLRAVNYYRLSGYLFPFRESGTDRFKSGTTLELVWSRYTFDRQLRLLVLDAIERIEIAIRTALVYELAHSTGPFGYTEPKNLPNLTGDRLGRFLEQLYDQTTHSQETFVHHFKSKYGDHHGYLPIWMSAELMTFGMMVTLFRGVDKSIKRKIGADLGITDDVLWSWIRSLNSVRNICAHHGRLWNRTLGDRPKIPSINKNPEWHRPVEVENRRMFGVLSVCAFLLKQIAPQSRWRQRLLTLLDDHSDIPSHSMGFPDNWMESPIWK